MRRIDSTHSIWLFDEDRGRFRRLPHGSNPDAPALDSDWESYHELDIDEATGAFTVVLNREGTRMVRAYRSDSPSVSADATLDITTTELRLPRPEST